MARIDPIAVRHYIGIDPGASTGLAVWDALDRRYTALCTSDFWTVFFTVMDYDQADTVIIIEFPKAIRRTFKDGNRAEVDPADVRKWDRISRNVGMNMQDAVRLAEGLERCGYRVERRKPAGAKWDPETFRQITGIARKTTEHERDAARFIHGLGTRYYPLG